jgi:hypothetical protein
MTNSVRIPLRKSPRALSGLRQFDAARLVRLGSDGELRTGHATAEAEEVLVLDSRASVRPAQAVERKLMVLLEGKAFSVSQLRTASFSSRSRAVFD